MFNYSIGRYRNEVARLRETDRPDHPLIPSLNKEGIKGWLENARNKAEYKKGNSVKKKLFLHFNLFLAKVLFSNGSEWF
jgi:hypothetical protein